MKVAKTYQSWNYDETKALTKNSYVLVGYDFLGWSINPDGTGTFALTSDVPTDYAVYRILADDADLNNITDSGFYTARNGNEISNKPTSLNQFGLQVVKTAMTSSGYYRQIAWQPTGGTIFTRYCSAGTWSSWVQIAYMTADDKTKLDGIASGAEVNVQSDWDESSSSSDAYIKNKPNIPTDYVNYEEQNFSGSKNLIPYPYVDGSSTTTENVTFTNSEEGWIYLNSTLTASGTANYVLCLKSKEINIIHFLLKEMMIVFMDLCISQTLVEIIQVMSMTQYMKTEH